MDWNLGQQKDTGHIQYFQQDKYVTDSDNESDEEGDFEVVFGWTCMTSSGTVSYTHLTLPTSDLV